MIINTTTDGTGTNPAITYSECYDPFLFFAFLISKIINAFV